MTKEIIKSIIQNQESWGYEIITDQQTVSIGFGDGGGYCQYCFPKEIIQEIVEVNIINKNLSAEFWKSKYDAMDENIILKWLEK